MKHYIGETYIYWHSGCKVVLKEVIGDKYFFECGHWCFDSIFEDLVREKTGEQEWRNKLIGKQLKIF